MFIFVYFRIITVYVYGRHKLESGIKYLCYFSLQLLLHIKIKCCFFAKWSKCIQINVCENTQKSGIQRVSIWCAHCTYKKLPPTHFIYFGVPSPKLYFGMLIKPEPIDLLVKNNVNHNPSTSLSSINDINFIN